MSMYKTINNSAAPEKGYTGGSLKLEWVRFVRMFIYTYIYIYTRYIYIIYIPVAFSVPVPTRLASLGYS